MPATPVRTDLRSELRTTLEDRHGPVLGGGDLRRALGYVNAAALRQARRRGQVTVPLFTLPKRRGMFALTRDVADWLSDARTRAIGGDGCSGPAAGTDPTP